MKYCFVPAAVDGFTGVTSMVTSVAGVTVSVVDPDMPPDVAVIVVEPAATEIANPILLIVATAGMAELQVAAVVRSCVVLSEYVPVAVNC